METYRTGRVLARVIAGIGWFTAAICVVLLVWAGARSSPVLWGEALFPFVLMLAGALSLVLLTWIARAIFDMASGANRGA